MTPEDFAKDEFRDYCAYRALAASEKNPEFKKILEELVVHEEEHFMFWRSLAGDRAYRPAPWGRIFLPLLRRLLGLTFTVRLLERHERDAIRAYEAYLKTAPRHLQKKVWEIIAHEQYHEERLIAHIREERVEFTGNIVLGLNDGLIEITGALIGFAFAFADRSLVALAGSIAGVTASLSMAASAYMQARHRAGENAVKAGIYTGVSYLAVVFFLLLPFFIAADVFLALAFMVLIITAIIAVVSFYTATLYARSFGKQFGEMVLFSVGVAAIAVAVGALFRIATGVSL